MRPQGVPADALNQIQDRFSFALGKFLSAGSAAAFGEEVARLARELAALAAQGGVTGLPAALLERIGIAPWAIEALMVGAQELTGLEVAAIARQIARHALVSGVPGPGNTGLPGQGAGNAPTLPQLPSLPGAGSNPPVPLSPHHRRSAGPQHHRGLLLVCRRYPPGPPEEEDPPLGRR